MFNSFKAFQRFLFIPFLRVSVTYGVIVPLPLADPSCALQLPHRLFPSALPLSLLCRRFHLPLQLRQSSHLCPLLPSVSSAPPERQQERAAADWRCRPPPWWSGMSAIKKGFSEPNSFLPFKIKEKAEEEYSGTAALGEGLCKHVDQLDLSPFYQHPLLWQSSVLAEQLMHV